MNKTDYVYLDHDYFASLNGFHNPKKHTGMDVKDFLKKWLVSTAKKVNKKNGEYYRNAINWAMINWDELIKKADKKFYNTFHPGQPLPLNPKTREIVFGKSDDV